MCCWLRSLSAICLGHGGRTVTTHMSGIPAGITNKLHWAGQLEYHRWPLQLESPGAPKGTAPATERERPRVPLHQSFRSHLLPLLPTILHIFYVPHQLKRRLSNHLQSVFYFSILCFSLLQALPRVLFVCMYMLLCECGCMSTTVRAQSTCGDVGPHHHVVRDRISSLSVHSPV